MAGVYLDSCVVIYYVQGALPIRHALGEDFAAAPRGLRVSDLTRLECRVRPIRNGNADLLARYDEFFSLPEVTHLPITSEVFDLATELRAQHSIRTVDALHLSAAIVHECDEFYTADSRLAAAAADHIRVRIASPQR